MRLPAGLDDAWRTLLAFPVARGELAGFTGTAVLEEADDDVHVAVFRLQGTSGTAAATARVTTALAPARDGTSIAFELDLHAGPGAEITREEVLAALKDAAARVPVVTAPDEPTPVPAVVAPAPAPPPPEPSSRPAKVALVAAGAAAALIAARALRKGS